MPYMNVTEVESALIGLAGTYPSICNLVTLPNLTIEGRTTHAAVLGTQAANTVDAYFLTGGVHAREWGSCEILINIATDLCEAYTSDTGVQYGGKYFSAAEVRALLQQINIIVFPCVNPDGRNFSQTSEALWRKNRNTAPSGGDPTKIGIDINRNQDFLWNFDVDFAAAAINDYLASDDPSQDTYHGASAQSEPETQNIMYIHNTFTRIKWYVDVHSYSEDILYVWGDDELQDSDPTLSFTNPAYNGQRGLVGDAYKEYIPDSDLSQLQTLAQAFTTSLAEVRGTFYVAKPGFSLYATSGANDDYAYCRHFSEPSKAKTLSFTVEWGTEFQPDWSEMENIILDVSAGLIALGLEAIGVDSFIVSNRDTFSNYEVQTTSSYPESLYVIYDGFAPTSLGVPGAKPVITFLDSIGGAVIPSITGAVSPADLEDPANPNNIQRISFTVEIDFGDTSAFTAEDRQIYVQSALAGLQDVAPIQLITQPNPYMDKGPISWLSTDVRVFQLQPGQQVNAWSTTRLHTLTADPNAPLTYINQLVGEMRGYGNTPAPPFEHISTDEETSQLELSTTVNKIPVFNFAVAKVRYRANSVPAPNVRVFFRTFNTMVSDLSYTTDPSVDVQNYRRTADGTVPLLGTNAFFSGAGNQITSIPYFANARNDTSTQSMDSQPDPLNTITLNAAGATEALEYFGCWLDFNQSAPQFPPSPASDGPFTNRIPITQFIRGIHTCMVAEVRFQPGATDPIPNGATPNSNDRLSQRNLSILESDNPGGPATHVVSHTLLIKASALSEKRETNAGGLYDELVIRWNDVPAGSTATIYFPDWDAGEVLDLMSRLRPTAPLFVKVDANTIGCTTRGVSYVPIPQAAYSQLPGLLTIQLPPGVRAGSRYDVDVQQHSGLTFNEVSQTTGIAALRKTNLTAGLNYSQRRVLGAYRMAVVVKAGPPLVEKLVRNLAVLKFIQLAIPPSDRWYPVFVRYIRQFSDKLSGLGVDPGLIPPSQDDPGLPSQHPQPKRECFTGKVSEVLFDRFGDFTGFRLETESHGQRLFRSYEKGIAELALRAAEHRLLITVCVCGKGESIGEIIVHRSSFL